MREAINLTLGAIQHRGRLYRNLVVTVSIVMVGTPLAALVMWSWLPLLGLALAPIAVAGHLTLDARVVHRWRRAVEAACAAERIPITEFAKTMSAVRNLPSGTLGGMLKALQSRTS